MRAIYLETKIKSNIEICFDIARSIDLHQISTAKSNEKAVAGITKGLINLNETVTWEAVHFGIRQRLTSKITQFSRPFHFRDEQVKGAFKYIIHDHNFEQMNEEVLLKERNNVIKEYAETDKWKLILNR